MDADHKCAENGGNLVSIHNMFENLFITGEAERIINGTYDDFWVGGDNLLIPGTWSWMDGSPWDFTDWDKGQPQNISDTNVASSLLQSGKWRVLNCLSSKPFVCLINTAPLKSCHDTWTYFNETGFCYKVLENQTWYNAEESCKTYGAHLASTHSQKESSFLTSKFPKRLTHFYHILLYTYYPGSESCDPTKITWIGLHYNSTSKTWKWSDGTKTDFINWMPGEPNNTNGDDCGLLSIAPICDYNSSLISDYYCNTVVARYICKMLPP